MTKLAFRRLGGLGSAVLLAVIGLAVSPAAADAASTCHSLGETYWIISGSRKTELTHVQGWQIPPGASSHKDRTVAMSVRLSASVGYTSGVKVEATTPAKVLGHVEGHFDVNVAASGELTRSTSETVGYKVPKATKDRYFAMYSGRTTYRGSWTYGRCDGDFWHIKKGKYRSYGTAELTGGGLCIVGKTQRKSAYDKGTAPYTACQQTWW